MFTFGDSELKAKVLLSASCPWLFRWKGLESRSGREASLIRGILGSSSADCWNARVTRQLTPLSLRGSLKCVWGFMTYSRLARLCC